MTTGEAMGHQAARDAAEEREMHRLAMAARMSIGQSLHYEDDRQWTEAAFTKEQADRDAAEAVKLYRARFGRPATVESK